MDSYVALIIGFIWLLSSLVAIDSAKTKNPEDWKLLGLSGQFIAALCGPVAIVMALLMKTNKGK